MAVDFDIFPIYDELTDNGENMSPIWILSMSTFIQTLQEYLSQYGMFVPNLTTDQRNQIQSPQLGQLIYNTTLNELEVWQIKTGTPLWRAITTTP